MRPTLHLALSVLALAGVTGCFHVVTEEVRVREPRQVSVLRADGTITLAAGAEPDAAVQSQGGFGRPFVASSYRVLVERDAAGSVALRCDACAGVWWGDAARPTLVTSEGVLLPATSTGLLASKSSAVTIGAEEVDLRVQTCLLTTKAKRRCQVDIEATLATPRKNVLEIRRRESPVPTIGALLLGWGLVPMGVGTMVAAGVVPRLSVLTRALVATPVIGVGAAVSSAGIWHLTAPVDERVIYPVPIE